MNTMWPQQAIDTAFLLCIGVALSYILVRLFGPAYEPVLGDEWYNAETGTWYDDVEEYDVVALTDIVAALNQSNNAISS